MEFVLVTVITTFPSCEHIIKERDADSLGLDALGRPIPGGAKDGCGHSGYFYSCCTDQPSITQTLHAQSLLSSAGSLCGA